MHNTANSLPPPGAPGRGEIVTPLLPPLSPVKRPAARYHRGYRRAAQALEDHRRRQVMQEQSLSSKVWKETDLVLTSTVGTPLDLSNLTYHTFQPFLRRAGFPK